MASITGFITVNSCPQTVNVCTAYFLPSSSLRYVTTPPCAFALYALKNPSEHMHALALVAFSTDRLFLGQDTHPPEILSGNVPGGHPRQSVAPAMLLVPSGQFMHPDTDVMPFTLEYLPGGQLRHMLSLDAPNTEE
jgi:hypothetical protein